MKWLAFFKIFVLPELKQIVGNRLLMVGLVALLLFSFLSIGFSLGSRDVLENKMKSPFIKFLPIKIPGTLNQGDFKRRCFSFLDSSEIKEQYGFVNYDVILQTNINFLESNDKSTEIAQVQKVDEKSEILNFILNEKRDELVLKSRFGDISKAPWSLIVTVDFIEKLGFTLETCPPFLTYTVYRDAGPRYTKMPVLAIVKQLPNQNDVFAAPLAFLGLRNSIKPENVMDPEADIYAKELSYFITGITKENENKLVNFLDKGDFIYELKPNYNTFYKGKDLNISVNRPELKQITAREVEEKFSLLSLEYYQQLAFPSSPTQKELRSFDYLNIQFSDLDSVQSFAKAFYNTLGLQPEMSTKEAADNFNLFNSIANVLSTVLIGLAVVMLVFAISQAILKHIDRNAQSLGTLKAFGLANDTITLVYSFISLVIIISLVVIAFILTAFFGGFVVSVVLKFVFLSGNYQEINYFRMIGFGESILIFVLIPAASITLIIYHKLKGATPGDLVYNR